MIRLFVLVLVLSALLAALTHVSVWIFFVPIGLFALYSVTIGGMRLTCPSCRKRVKIGATACHHCGRDVRRSADA
jgi:hypothetical protein